jgi:hypothetical protein
MRWRPGDCRLMFLGLRDREEGSAFAMQNFQKSQGRVLRDEAWIEREYGHDKWPAVLEEIQRSIAAGECSLPRVMTGLVRQEWNEPDLRMVTAISGGERVRLPCALAWYGFYALVTETVIAACGNDTEAIVDLGCGWGRSLFDVWLRGGPRSATYYAMEFTQAGRDCVMALAALEPAMLVRAARFDYRNPDFSLLPKRLKHAVVYTIASTDQVSFLEKNAYRRILDIAEAIDCLHFEHIGWQMEPGPQTTANRDYVLRNDYNQNLWALVTELKNDGEIELVEARPDLFGPEAHYPLSIVHWRLRRNQKSP